LPSGLAVVDIIYHPARTRLPAVAAICSCRALNGGKCEGGKELKLFSFGPGRKFR